MQDKECERVIFTHIRGFFPSHKFIGEESSADQGFTSSLSDEPTWLIDPLDGAPSYAGAKLGKQYAAVCCRVAATSV